MKNKRNTRILLLSAALLICALLANLCLGASGLSIGAIAGAVFKGDRESVAARIFYFVRLPRALAAMLAGSALAVAGQLLQKVLRNPLASPGVIGINSGAGLCALIVMAFLPEAAGLTPLAAFSGALLTAFGVYFLARLTGESRAAIVLAGVAVNSLLGAAMDAIVTLIPDAAVSRSAFSIGGFANVTMKQLTFALPFWAAGLLAAMIFQRELQLMTLGDEVAASLGLPVERFRAVFLIAAALLAGAAVSFAGLLGFVGLLAPHMARRAVGHAHKRLLPCAMLGGALMVLCADMAARTLFAPYEVPVGVLLSLIGGPFFLHQLLKGAEK